MKEKDEVVIAKVDGMEFHVRQRLKDACEGKGELDDEFRKTFTEEEKEYILRVLFVH